MTEKVFLQEESYSREVGWIVSKPICHLTALAHIQYSSRSCQLCLLTTHPKPLHPHYYCCRPGHHSSRPIFILVPTAFSSNSSRRRDPFSMAHFALLLKTLPYLPATHRIKPRFRTKVYKALDGLPPATSLPSFCATPSFACPLLSSHIGFPVWPQTTLVCSLLSVSHLLLCGPGMFFLTRLRGSFPHSSALPSVSFPEGPSPGTPLLSQFLSPTCLCSTFNSGCRCF